MVFSLGNSRGQKFDRIDAGLKIGANYTMPKMIDLESMRYNNQFGLEVGLFAKIKFRNNLAIRIESFYSSQNIQTESFDFGTREGDVIGTAEFDEKIKDEYLIFTSLFSPKLFKKLNVLIGPQIGLLLSENRRLLVIDNILYYQNEQIDNVSLSGNLGFSFDINKFLNFGLRYSIALIKTNSLKNNIVQIYLGYAIF